MKLIDLIKANRSCRRFVQSDSIGMEHLEGMVEAARLSASARNIQPIKYLISNGRETNVLIFRTLAWAGYYTEWDGPEEGERPSAYIIQLLDRNIAQTCMCDNGIGAQSILLQATEYGYGGCIIGAVKREELARSLGIDTSRFEILNVIALGKPAEKILLEDMKDNQYKYWRDEDGTHHVPKRSLEEIVWKRCTE